MNTLTPNESLPIGLRKPWVWVQPKNREELIQRLLDAREYAVPERERENLCSVAYELLRSQAASSYICQCGDRVVRLATDDK